MLNTDTGDFTSLAEKNKAYWQEIDNKVYYRPRVSGARPKLQDHETLSEKIITDAVCNYLKGRPAGRCQKMSGIRGSTPQSRSGIIVRKKNGRVDKRS
jgi:hypothetical protein